MRAVYGNVSGNRFERWCVQAWRSRDMQEVQGREKKDTEEVSMVECFVQTGVLSKAEIYRMWK